MLLEEMSRVSNAQEAERLLVSAATEKELRGRWRW